MVIFNDFKQDSFDEFSLGLSIGDTKEQRENLLHMILMNENKPLFIQTPRLKYTMKDDTVSIQFKGKTQSKVDDFYSFMRSLEQYVSQLVSSELHKLSTDIVTSQLYKTCIQLPDKLSEPPFLPTTFTEPFEVYNRKVDKIDFDKLSESQDNHYCTFILFCECVSVTPTCAQMKWGIGQALLHPQKKKKKKSKEFGIHEDSPTEKPVLHFRQLGVVSSSSSPKVIEPEVEVKEEPDGITIRLD